MKSIVLFLTVFITFGIAAASPTFPKQHGISKPSIASSHPLEITVDFADERFAFSPYLFALHDAPEPIPQGYTLAKEANFKVICMTQFTNKAFSLTLPEDKALLLVEKGFEGVLFFPVSHFRPKEELEKEIEETVGTVEKLKQAHPSLEIKTFIFGYEPDIEGNIFWDGSKEQFFESYEVFARYLKSRNRKYLVGGANFSSYAGDWPKDFIRYMSEHQVPLDIVSFHAYSFEIQKGFLEAMDSVKKLLIQFPITRCLFDKPQIAVTEWDIKRPSYEASVSLDAKDAAWRAAHHILALSAMAEQGLWLSCENFDDTLWSKSAKSLDPGYYAHKAFNALADTIRLAQNGSDFRTLGVSAGKSRDGRSVVMVISNFDPNAYGANFLNEYELLPQASEAFDQITGLQWYRSFSVRLTHLPWNQNDTLVLERYRVNETAAFELQEITEYKGSPEFMLRRDIGMPEVQLIKVYRKD